MTIIAPCTGAAPDQKTADYVVRIAKRLKLPLVVVRILAENETVEAVKQLLEGFLDIGRQANVPVTLTTTRRGDIAAAIVDVAVERAAQLILLNLSHGEIVAEWMNAQAMQKTDIPVLLIPKWVAPAKPAASNGPDRPGA